MAENIDVTEANRAAWKYVIYSFPLLPPSFPFLCPNLTHRRLSTFYTATLHITMRPPRTPLPRPRARHQVPPFISR